jgi:inward rectifier potassium channel
MADHKTQFDPGLTERYTGQIRKTIQPDGSFNVRREGVRLKDAGWFLYFMNLSWPAFLIQMPLIYLGIIGVFAGLYVATGVEYLQGAHTGTTLETISSAFFFSVQTFTTVGYGHISPSSLTSSTIAAIEAMSGILSLAIATGLIYARFSRPTAHLAFSTNALVAPFQGGQALMLRVANRRPNILMELEATLLLMTVEQVDGQWKRRFAQLELERPSIYFLPLAWTIVHPIDDKSPLYGKSIADFEAVQAEFLVLVKAFDDTFSQVVHARSSYLAKEIVWGARFEPAFHIDDDGAMVLDLDRLNAHALLEPPLKKAEP